MENAAEPALQMNSALFETNCKLQPLNQSQGCHNVHVFNIYTQPLFFFFLFVFLVQRKGLFSSITSFCFSLNYKFEQISTEPFFCWSWVKRLWRSGLIFIWGPFRCPSSNWSADSQIPSEPTAAQHQSVSQPVSLLLQGWGSVHGGMLHTRTATSRRLSLTSAMISNNHHLDRYYNDINSGQMLSSVFSVLLLCPC